MKEITVYEATDGRRFKTKEQCEQYEIDGCVEYLPLPKFGDHEPLTQDALRWMLNGDGSCYYATATKMTHVHPRPSNHPSWATHLVYFGK